ncbi:MAG: addiction module toxin RelE [Gammaproteobacteria bacterium]|nr:addiction module toxin RelE [Gammaproteobacteria bacterium]MYG66166.1 addiction module toxin RelE [Gammaproteobacteria bacterium]
MQTAVETPTFTRQAEDLFNEDEKRELIDFLAANPMAGTRIPGTGGVRKIRYSAQGRGKRGGARVIYFFGGKAMPVYALLVYGKAVKTDLSHSERKTVSALVKEIKREQRRRYGT